MIKTITVKNNSTAEKIFFFKNVDVTGHRIIPLYGANGVGKTTLLKEIQFALYEIQEQNFTSDSDDEFDLFNSWEKSTRRIRAGIEHDSQVELTVDPSPTVYYKYRNGTDNFRVSEPRSQMEGVDPVFIINKWNAKALSEGQSIVYSVKDLLTGMLRSTKTHESFIEDDDTHGIILLDEIDSGLSIDNLDEILRIIKRVIKQGRNIQFFMSFNNPYVIKYFPEVLSMYDGQWKRFSDQDEMLADLMENKKILDKARKSRGRYKIFD
jgi:Fe-S cluster assembly ATPase SufC